MRKLVAAIAFLAVTVLPATALAQPHRYRGEDFDLNPEMIRERFAAYCERFDT